MADSLFGDLPGPNPGASGLSNGAVFHVDSRGFWQYARGKTAGRPGWLLIGDSVTMGIGVQPDSTFAGILTKNISADFELLNPSLIGYSSRHYRDLVRHFLLSDQNGFPEIRRITVFWCLNDAYDGVQIHEPDGKFRRMAEPLLRFARQNVYTYQWMKASFLDRPKRYYDHDAALYSGESFDRAVSHLAELAALCDLQGVACDIILLPYEYQLRSGDIQPQSMLKNQLANLSLRVHDPFSWIMNQTDDPSKLFLYGDGIHYSNEGHRLIAEYLLEHVAATRVSEPEF